MYHCPHRGLYTDKLDNLCPECIIFHGKMRAIFTVKMDAEGHLGAGENTVATGDFDWPDELPKDCKL